MRSYSVPVVSEGNLVSDGAVEGRIRACPSGTTTFIGATEVIAYYYRVLGHSRRNGFGETEACCAKI